MAQFNREHFKRIAAMLKAVKPLEEGGWNGDKLFNFARRKQWDVTVDRFASEFRILNPKFDVDKFKRACDR